MDVRRHGCTNVGSRAVEISSKIPPEPAWIPKIYVVGVELVRLSAKAPHCLNPVNEMCLGLHAAALHFVGIGATCRCLCDVGFDRALQFIERVAGRSRGNEMEEA